MTERSTRLELRSIESLGGSPSWLDQGDSVRHVVHDAVEWTRLWNSRQSGNWPQLPPPPVDFGREVLLVAGWGSNPTTGYTISIDSAVHRGRVIEVHVSRVQVCEHGMAVTWPMAIARIPRPRGRIVYIDQPLRSCGA